ncbi:MAG: hypothetical protein JWR22_1325 [Herminiimonas sp.]|nr:hypothetical protein [Herminiimonas sp.]
MKLAKVLGALSYAHLLGISAAKVEDDEKKQRADESDEDYAKRMEDGDEKKEKDDDAKKAEEEEKKKDDEAKKAEEDKEKEKSKKAEESDDEEKDKAARQSERARCAAIFACEAAGSRPDMAAHLAFNTDMTVDAATEMLKTISAGHVGKTRSLANRMAEVQTPNVGTEAGAAPAADSPQGVAARIVAAGKLRRGES